MCRKYGKCPPLLLSPFMRERICPLPAGIGCPPLWNLWHCLQLISHPPMKVSCIIMVSIAARIEGMRGEKTGIIRVSRYKRKKGAGRASSTWARLIHRIFEVNPGISLIPPFGIPSSLWSLTSTIPGMPIKKSPEVLPDHYSQKQGVYPYASGKPDKAAQNRKISPMPT